MRHRWVHLGRVFCCLPLLLAGAAAMAQSNESGESTGEQASAWWQFGPDTLSQLLSTLALIVVIIAVRGILVRKVARAELRNAEARRQIIVSIRNGAIILIIVGLFIIWATELRTLAISLFAITAAIVIATKELILCLSGGIYKAITKNCRVGDRVEISGLRGDVIDQTLLCTTIMEIGPGSQTQQHTGRAIVLPNVVFLSGSLINESYTKDYVAHTFQVPLTTQDDWHRAERILLEASRIEVAEFIEDARRHMKTLQQKHGFDAPSIDPRVIVRIPDAGKLLLIVRIPAPARRKGRVEQAITRRFLEEFYHETGEEEETSRAENDSENANGSPRIEG